MGAGDRVGILIRVASVEYITLALGVLRLGAICVPLNARNKSHELRYAAGHAGLRVLLASDEFTALVEEAGRARGLPRTSCSARGSFEAGSAPEDEVLALQAQIAPGGPGADDLHVGHDGEPEGLRALARRAARRRPQLDRAAAG